MAFSETSPSDSGTPADTQVQQGVQTGPEPPSEEERFTRRFRGSGASATERDRVLKGLRSIEFPSALRGYDRSAVDRYVEQVNLLIAELEISASPESAVRHALDEVSEETRGLLHRAHQTAEQIVSHSRTKAEEQLAQAELEAKELRDKAQREAEEVRGAAQHDARELGEAARHETAELREAAAHEASQSREAAARESQRVHGTAQREAEELRANARRDAEETIEAAESRARELARSAETIWRERRRLIDDVRTVGDQLVAIGEAEAKRFAHFAGDGLFAGQEPPPEGVGATASEDQV